MCELVKNLYVCNEISTLSTIETIDTIDDTIDTTIDDTTDTVDATNKYNCTRRDDCSSRYFFCGQIFEFWIKSAIFALSGGQT